MKISHTPHSGRNRIGWRRPSHPLKSPTTLTRRAFGAQTAKTTPETPSTILRMRPKHPMDLEVISFLEQMQLGFLQEQRELIGILELDLLFADGSSQPIVETLSAIMERAGEETSGVEFRQFADHRPVVGIDNPHPARPGYERTHHQGTFCARRPVHAEHGERVAMFAAHNSRHRSVVDGRPYRLPFASSLPIPLRAYRGVPIAVGRPQFLIPRTGSALHWINRMTAGQNAP